MKKVADINTKMSSMIENDEKQELMPTVREILRTMGNVKATTADDARRTARIITKIRDPKMTDLILENDDLSFLQKRFEDNQMGLTAWMQGQLLDIFDNAEKVEAAKV